MSVEVTAITVYFQDYNSDKFYRVYYFDKWAFFMNGRRNTTGTFRDITKHTSPAAAKRAALDKLYSKEAEGYIDRETVTFQYDLSRWGGTKESCRLMDWARLNAIPNAPAAPPAAPAPAPPAKPAPPAPAARPARIEHELDRLTEFNARALAAITQAVSDPTLAAAEFARLNATYSELERELSKARSYLSTLDNLLGVPA